jgi:hypothetical protein
MRIENSQLKTVGEGMWDFEEADDIISEEYYW